MTKHKKDPKKATKADKTASAKKPEATDETLDSADLENVQKDEVNPLEAELSALKSELETAKAKIDENWELYLRANADLENARRRAQQDIEKARKFGLDKLVEDLLPIKDSIEMGLVAATQTDDANIEKLHEGSELILKMFSDTMEKYGIEMVVL